MRRQDADRARARARARVTCTCTIFLAACEPALDQRLAIVKEPRVLAIVSEPAEVRPAAAASYTIVVGSPDGPVAAAPAWSLCTAPKPPTEDNAVSAACTKDPSALAPLAGPMATIPSDACMLFGPDVPPGGFRPRDPDPTGGYYQPVAADTGMDLAFGFTRITCNLPTAPPDVAHDYQTMYVANANPTLDPPQVPATVAAGSTVTLVASWPAGAVETYLYFDPAAQALVTRREAMRVSWFATGGELAVDASAVAETDDATQVSTTWRTPATPGPAWLWFVLRDSRGGIATETVAVTIQ